ncbi:hypothetical protein GCM10010123_27760 [Pilimelia anulata]|uniref:Uncharacterized protein n=1 Tax=Pilimelia anulata TaxID=53371 RepID=A0A8J3BBT9_9ACTN|nr:hypothetical protein [Pilimelia anulata]GGJ96256.1 hypothetical protein GCM10010123_27760 [Pilimelia anulata]
MLASLFRPRPAAPAPAAEPAVTVNHQLHMLDIADAFAALDRATLAGVNPHLRAGQLAARWDLWMFVERIWDDAGRRGIDPAADPRYAAVAALRDLMGTLYETADEAQRLAGDLEY